MDEDDKFIIKRIQTNLNEVIETGTTEPQTVWALVDNALDELYKLKDQEINTTIKQYFTEQQHIKTEIKKHQTEQEKLAKKYADNVKNMYEEIKKL